MIQLLLLGPEPLSQMRMVRVQLARAPAAILAQTHFLTLKEILK